MASLTLLGTGNATGMPVYGCECEFCRADRTSGRKRTPCSALLETDAQTLLIDAGQMDLHERFPAGTLDGILLTHFHPDHVQGLFHLRWGKNTEIPVYSPPDEVGCADLYKHSGILKFQRQQAFESFQLKDLSVTPVPLIHSKPTFGYVCRLNEISVAYLTDTKGLPPDTSELLESLSLDLLVIDCSFLPAHPSKGHNNLDDVFEIQQSLSARQVVLTHIGHDLDIWLRQHPDVLPSEYVVGHDGLVLNL